MSSTEKGVEVTGFCSIPEAEGEGPARPRPPRNAAPRASRLVAAGAADPGSGADAWRPGLRLRQGHPYGR